MNFKEVFSVEKPVIAMLHLKGKTHEEILERAQKEADLLISCGVDAVLVEDYFGDEEDVISVLKMAKGRTAALLLRS